jgi:hypothetical protein
VIAHRGGRACRDDRGREAVYAAEEAAFGGTDLADQHPLADLQAQVTTIVDGEWWRPAGGLPVDLVAARRDARSSSTREGDDRAVIRVADGHFDVATVAHELAHVLAGIDHGHDEQFRAAHVDVVAVLAGSAAGSMLAGSYGTFGLPVGVRTWLPPVRGSGEAFVIVP